MKLKKFLGYEWDVIAGTLAAVIAVILHLLHALQPRIAECSSGVKVQEPRWCQPGKTTSFILADSQSSGGTEALLSFWGEPFMAQSTEQDVPRFIFHIQKNSELLPHLIELQRAQSRSNRLS